MASLFPQGRASLPPFKSLLVPGPYHPSAPIHLALSSTASSDSDALLISPSRHILTNALASNPDAWLNANGTCGETITASSRVKMLYPPTPAHFIFLFSSLEMPAEAPLHRKLNEKTTLDAPPAIIIILELSSYFMPDVESNPLTHQWTISSYLSLVSQVLSIATFLSPESPVPVVLFDSQLHLLRLPVVKFSSVHRSHTDEGQDDNTREKIECIADLAQRFFGVVARFCYTDIAGTRHCNLQLYYEQNSNISPSWDWTEQKDKDDRTWFIWS